MHVATRRSSTYVLRSNNDTNPFANYKRDETTTARLTTERMLVYVVSMHANGLVWCSTYVTVLDVHVDFCINS